MPSKNTPAKTDEVEVIRPSWWRAAARHLGRADPVFRGVIQHSRQTSWRAPSDPFVALARAIIGQQISVAAANGIWRRLLESLSAGAALPPERVLEA